MCVCVCVCVCGGGKHKTEHGSIGWKKLMRYEAPEKEQGRFVCSLCLVEKSGFEEVWTFWLNWTEGISLNNPLFCSLSKYYENTVNPIPFSLFNFVSNFFRLIIISNLLLN